MVAETAFSTMDFGDNALAVVMVVIASKGKVKPTIGVSLGKNVLKY